MSFFKDKIANYSIFEAQITVWYVFHRKEIAKYSIEFFCIQYFTYSILNLSRISNWTEAKKKFMNKI